MVKLPPHVIIKVVEFVVSRALNCTHHTQTQLALMICKRQRRRVQIRRPTTDPRSVCNLHRNPLHCMPTINNSNHTCNHSGGTAFMQVVDGFDKYSLCAVITAKNTMLAIH